MLDLSASINEEDLNFAKLPPHVNNQGGLVIFKNDSLYDETIQSYRKRNAKTSMGGTRKRLGTQSPNKRSVMAKDKPLTLSSLKNAKEIYEVENFMLDKLYNSYKKKQSVAVGLPAREMTMMV